MAMDVIFSTNPIHERDSRLARQFEQAVAEALRGGEDVAGDARVSVRFNVWDGDDVPRYVCKVECSGADARDREAAPWRWWSPLVETPQELGQELRDALRAAGRRRARPDDPRPEAAVERWGWGGEMQSTWTS